MNYPNFISRTCLTAALCLMSLLTFLFTSCTYERPTEIMTIKGWGNGVNIMPSYYNNGNPTIGWSLMREQTKIKTIRIEIEPDKVEQAKTWISQASINGYNIICTYHNQFTLGSDSLKHVINAANWWLDNYATLRAFGPFVINMINEWGSHKISSKDYANTYNQAIAIVRSVYKGPVIIDAPGWGQEVITLAEAVKGTNCESIKDSNIVLSLHIYSRGWNERANHWLQASDIDILETTGKTCIIGEFGLDYKGECKWSEIVLRAKSKGWPIIAWCWNGDGEGLNMVDPSWQMNSKATEFKLSPYFDVIYKIL